MNKSSHQKNPRRQAREYAVQALYQWQLSPLSVGELLLNFSKDHDFSTVDGEYWRELVAHGVEQADVLDLKMRPFLSRPIEAVNPVERAILRVAFYELCFRIDIPYRCENIIHKTLLNWPSFLALRIVI